MCAQESIPHDRKGIRIRLSGHLSHHLHQHWWDERGWHHHPHRHGLVPLRREVRRGPFQLFDRELRTDATTNQFRENSPVEERRWSPM